MSKNNKIIIAAIAVVALLVIIGALFASGIFSGNDDDHDTISYKVSFIDGDDVIKTLNIKENNLVSRITNPEKEGYVFTGWYAEKELINEFDFENTRITENTSIYAKWVKESEPEPGDITFTITFNIDGGSKVASQTVKEKEKAVKPADPVKSGYTFAGWYSNSSFTSKFDFETPITSDITLYAKFTANQGGGGGSTTPSEKTYIVSFESDGGNAIASQNVRSGEKAVKPADPTRSEYTFAGWYSDKELTTAYDFSIAVSDNITLYAKWAVGTYDVDGNTVIITVNPANSDIINELVKKDIIEIADTSNYEDANTVCIPSDLLSNIQQKNESDKTLSVKTAKGSVQLSSEVVDSIIRTNADSVVAIKISKSSSETRYDIEITSDSDSITQFPDTIKISIPYTLREGENPQDISVYYIDSSDKEHLVHGTYNEDTKCIDILTNHLSTYEIKNNAKYSVNFILNGGSFIDDFNLSDYIKLEFNKCIKYVEPEMVGYIFAGWFKDEALLDKWDFETDVVKTLDTNNLYTINLYAKWETDSYDITYYTHGGTNSSNNPKEYKINTDTIIFENPIKEGYTFNGWFTDENFKNQITSIIKGSSGNISIYANWEKNKYSVVLSSGMGYELDQLQNSKNIVEHGGSFQFKLSIDEEFIQSTPVVKSNGKIISAESGIYTIQNITENQIVTVEEIKNNTYNITFANEDGYYIVDNSGPVNHGADFTFTITLDDAYSKSALTNSSVKAFGKYGSISMTGENAHQYTITNVTSDIVILVDGLKKNEYFVTFISDNHEILKQKVNHGDSASLINNLTKPGYEFDGWYTDVDGNIEYSNDAITKDTILYAKWSAGTTSYFIYIYQEKISYTENASIEQIYELIKIEQKSGKIESSISVDYNEYLTETILGSKHGFDFNNSISNVSGKISAENPLILKLYFDRNEFKMIFNAPDGSTFESVSEISAKYGMPVYPIRVTLPGDYTLDYWYESDENTPYLFTTMPDHDVNLHSKYTKIYYLEYHANGGIGTSPYKIGYTNGTNVILFGPGYPTSDSYVLTKEGYTFGGWEYNGVTYYPSDSFMMPSSNVTMYAVWNPIEYSVIFNSNDGTGSMNDQTFTYDTAQKLTLNSYEKKGHSFAGWSETSNGEVKYADQALVNNLVSDNGAKVTLYAVWNINQYTITFDSNDGSAVAPITADYNTSITKPIDPIKAGHTFIGWHSDKELTTAYSFMTMPAENITLYAKWTINSYNVTFHYNNGSEIAIENVEFNSSITEQENVSKLGYTLDGWYSDSEFNSKWDFASDKMPTHDVHLYAKWSAESYTITYYNGTETISSAEYTVESDSIEMPADPSKTGYSFDGWFDRDEVNKFNYIKGTTVGDIDLYAKFTINQYTITFNSNGGSETAPITQDYNSDVTLPNPTKEGYTFAGWYSDESLNTEYTSSKMPADNITLYAKWNIDSYTLTINYIYEDGSTAHDSYTSILEYNSAYSVLSPSIEHFLPDVPTVSGTMPANGLTITVTYGEYLINLNGTNYRTIEDALVSAQEGDRLILLRDYTLQNNITIPNGVLLVIPCHDGDEGYDVAANYESEHNPDGTTSGTEKCDYLYRTLTVSSDATITVEGQLLVNAVTGRTEGGYRVMDITGGYAQIILNGNIVVKDEGILEVCGYIKGEGQVTAESGAEVREMYIVQHWRGGSQALAIYPNLFPFNEYDCHSIHSKLVIKSGASLFGNVKMYETWYNDYHYTRFPQIDNENGMIRLSDGAHLVKTYDHDVMNGTSVSDTGTSYIDIYGGATFSHSTLNIVGLDLSTKDFIYPIDGDMHFGLHSGTYIVDNDFKILTGAQVILYEEATLTLNKGNTLVLYDEFNDKPNTNNTQYPDRPSAVLILNDGSQFNILGTFAGIVIFADSGTASIDVSEAEALDIHTKEVNGYVGNHSPSEVASKGYVSLYFETKYQHTISFETNGGSELPSVNYFRGDYIDNLPEPEKTGFDFKGWYLDSGLTQKYDYDDLTGNITLYAKWETSKHIVTFEANNGGSAAPQEVSYGNTVSEPEGPARAGYVFAGWYSDKDLTAVYDFSTPVTESITLYAKWAANEYTISFVTNNEEHLESITYTADDDSLNIDEISKTGYIFDKWYIDKELTTEFVFKQYETYGNLTLYAKWAAEVYTIKYYDGTQLNLTPGTYIIEDTLTLPVPTKSGYTFMGWHENSSTSGNAVFSIDAGTTGNKEYHASWTETVYSITYMDGEKEIENLYPASYTTTKRTELPTPVKEGYTFSKWYSDEDFTTEVTSIPTGSTGDKTLYAKFTINQYTITFNSNGGSEVDSITQEYGTLISKPNDPTREGYTFAGWFKDNEFSNEWNFESDTMPVDGTTLYANWTANSYTVAFDANGGTGSMENQDFTYDISQKLTANTFEREGYSFLGWSSAADAAEASYTNGQRVSNLTPENGGNVTLYAVWKVNQYTITFNSNGGSEVDSITQEYGTCISKPNDPTREGYTFAGWFKDNEFSNEWNFESDTMPVDGTTLYAKFTINQYTITFNSNGGSEVDSITQEYGTLISKPNDPTREGYTFAGWFKDNEFSNEWNFESDTMPVDGTTLYANWTANSYNVNYYVDSTLYYNEKVTYGTDVPKPADPTKTGHTFKNWGADIPETMPAEDLEFYAVFEINTHTITYKIDGDIVETQTYVYGQTISPYQPQTQEGNEFSGWNPALPETMPDNDLIVSGTFDALTFTITYYVDGKQQGSPYNVKFGDAVTPLESPAKEGYTFSGWDWNGDDSGLGTAPETMPAKHLRVDGYFTINSYEVTFHYNNENENTTSLVEFNSKITEPENVSKLGYSLEGWYSDSTFTNKWNFESDTMPSEDLNLYAKWNLITYVIKYYDGSEELTTLNPKTYTVESDEIILPIPVKTGYTFSGWYVDPDFSGDIVTSIPAESTGNKTFYAKFTANSYTVTFDANGGTGSMENQDFTYDISQKLTANTFEREGYSFLGWSSAADAAEASYTNGQRVSNLTSENGGNVTLYAVWKVNQYTITFNSNGGSETAPITADYNSSVTLPTPTKEGYTFAGWYSDESLNTEYTSDKMPADNITLYAKWVANNYTVTFHYNNENENTTSLVEFNSKITEPENVSKLGYSLEGWYSDSTFTNKWNFESNTMPSEDLNLYANWTVVTYTISFNPGDGVESIGDMQYNVEMSITLLTPTKEGYTFAGWYENDTEFEYVKGTTTGNHSLIAKWTAEIYTITYMDGDNEISGLSPATYTYESAETLQTPAEKTGYAFTGWYVDPDFSGDIVTSIPAESTGNKTFYAKFTANSYTVAFDANGGTGSMENQKFAYGETKNLTINSFEKKGYSLKGWSETSDGEVKYTDTQEVSNLTSENGGNVTLYAVWEVIEYTIHYVIASDADELTFVNDPTFTISSANPSSYTIEDRRVLIIDGNTDNGLTTREGYTFSKWTIYQYPISNPPVEPVGVKNNDSKRVTITGITGDILAISHWTINSYTISFDSAGGSNISPFSGEYKSKITKPDDPTREGYTFAGWYKDSSLTTPWDFAEDTMPVDGTTLYAKWASETNKVTLPTSSAGGYNFTTAPLEGYAADSVSSGSDFKFTVTFNTALEINELPMISWDGNVRGPDSKAGYQYTFTIPEVTKNITVGLQISDTSGITSLINSSTSQDYALSFDLCTLTISISKPNADAQSLISSICEVIGENISQNIDSGRSGITTLLAYLPDDDTLWENNLAEYVVEAAGYKIVFKQDADAIEEAKIQYLTEIAQAVRVFRDNPVYYPISINGINYSEIFSVSAGVEDNNKFIDIGVRYLQSGNDNLSLAHALASNYATVVALVGHEDAVWGKYSLDTNFTNSEKVSLDVDLKTTLDVQQLYRSAVAILEMMEMPISGAFDPVSYCFKDGIGYGGYGKYLCLSEKSGVRYTDTYSIAFSNYFEGTDPAKHNIIISDDLISIITLQDFGMSENHSLVNIPFEAPVVTGMMKVVFNENSLKYIYDYELSQLSPGELIVINMNNNSGLTMDQISITSSVGPITWYNENSFIMPDGDVAISLKTESAEIPVISSQPQSLEIYAGGTLPLSILASVGSGSLTYAWYKGKNSTDVDADGNKKVGTDSTYIIPDDLSIGTHYYFCVVTNTNHGTTSSIVSDIVSVTVVTQSMPYTISFNTNGGKNISNTECLSGNELSLPISDKFGYVFGGWYTDSELVVPAPSVMPSNDLTLYAKWNNALSPNGSVTVFENGETYPWLADDSVSDFPTYKSSNYDVASTESNFSVKVNGPGILFFYYMISSEKNYDYLRVILDDKALPEYTKASYSGEVPWTQASINISGDGEHIIEWIYSKDISSTMGQDSVWVNRIYFIPEGSTETVNVNIGLDLPEGYDSSQISFKGLSAGSNSLPMGVEQTIELFNLPEDLVFMGWKAEYGEWIVGDGMNVCTNTAISTIPLYDFSIFAVFAIDENILPEIEITQNDINLGIIYDGRVIEYEYEASKMPEFIFSTDSDNFDTLNASLNGKAVDVIENKFIIDNICADSTLTITAYKTGYVPKVMSITFKPTILLSDLCTDGSVDRISTNGQYPWSLDNAVSGSTAYFSGNNSVNTSLSELIIEVTGSGALTLDYRIVSNGIYNMLLYNLNEEITLDNLESSANYVDRSNYSGEIDWTTKIIEIDAADNQKTYVYLAFCLTGSSSNINRAWISNVSFSSGSMNVAVDDPGQAGKISITSDGTSLNCGTNELRSASHVSLSVEPASGYEFYGWIDGNGNILSLNAEYSFIVTNDISISAVLALDGLYVARNCADWYTTLEDALEAAVAGDTVILINDYTMVSDATVKAGVFLLLPCMDNDIGYTSTGYNPDGTSASSEDLSRLYRTLTIPSNITLAVEGQIMVNAVTGRPAAGHNDQDITGGYAQIILDGKMAVKNGGIVDNYGYIKGNGQITAESGAEVRDTYVVRNWRGGTQALIMYLTNIFPFNEYDCHNIQTTLRVDSGASLLGNVKMYASDGYNYTRFPQIDNNNGLIRLADNAYLIKTYDGAVSNGSNADVGRTHISIFGGATFSSSGLNIVGYDLSTDSFLYPIDGDISFGLHSGDYSVECNFKVLTGSSVTVYDDATLTISADKKLILYDIFNDAENTSTTKYPSRPPATLTLKGTSTITVLGTFAGTVLYETGLDQIILGENAVTTDVSSFEANGYKTGTIELFFNMCTKPLEE